MYSGTVRAEVELVADTELSTAGYFNLSWSSSDQQLEDAPMFELQRASSDDFKSAMTLYRGSDTSSVISGLHDGNYYFRVRDVAEGAWSEVVSVEVNHHPLSRAVGFFVLGAVMFLVMVIVLFKADREQGS